MDRLPNFFYLPLALTLTVALFLIGGQKQAGEVFTGYAHWIAHFGVYAVIAICYAKGLIRFNPFYVGCLVAALGGLHEVYEIRAHDHGFEADDFFVNSLGAFAGALFSWFGRKIQAF